MSEEPTKIYYLHDTIRQSVIRDALSAASTIGIIGLGVFLRSPAMQWIGFVIICLSVIARASSQKATLSISPQEAADRLFRDFGVKARGDDAS